MGEAQKVPVTEAELLLDMEPLTEPEAEGHTEALPLRLMVPETEGEPLELGEGVPEALTELLLHTLQLLLTVKEALKVLEAEKVALPEPETLTEAVTEGELEELTDTVEQPELLFSTLKVLLTVLEAL